LHLFVFCLLVVLVKLSVLAKWLARKIPLRNLFVVRRLSPQSPGHFRFSVLFHCFIVCLSCPPALHDIAHTPMAWYSLFVLKVPLNTNQPTNLMQAHGMALISVSIAVSQVPTYRVRPCCVALNCTSVTGADCSYPLMDGRVSGATWLVTYPPADGYPYQYY